jgi:hypothetical protein
MMRTIYPINADDDLARTRQAEPIAPEAAFDRALWNVQRAACAYASSRVLQLAESAVATLRNVPKIELYGDQDHSSLWDEYCHSTGVEDGWMDEAWDHHISSVVQLQIEALSPSEAVLLSAVASWDDGTYECAFDAINNDALTKLVAQQLRWLATE